MGLILADLSYAHNNLTVAKAWRLAKPDAALHNGHLFASRFVHTFFGGVSYVCIPIARVLNAVCRPGWMV